MGQSVMQEFVVKLGAQVDNNGFQQILNLLDSNKLKALGVAAALTAATTAVYKFIESATKQEFELKKLAKQQRKNVEAVRAQETALKSMGMTIKDINRDKDLKEIYKDIKSTNEALSLPNMEGALKNVNELRGAFWKLRSVASYAIQWINFHALSHLSRTITRISKNLNTISDWFTKNMNSITSKAGAFIASFARGVISIFEFIQKIGEKVNSLPDGVKRIGAAITTVIALLKSGPIGQILTMITWIGAVIDDYETYMNNINKGLNPGDTGYGNTALPGIWQFFEQGFTEDAIKEALQEVMKRVTKALKTFWTEDLVNDFSGSFFNGGEGAEGGGLLSGMVRWLEDESNQKAMLELGDALITFIGGTVRNVGGFAGAGVAKLMNIVFGEGTIPENVFDDAGVGATFAGTLGTFFKGFFEKLSSGGDIKDAFLSGLGSGAVGALITAFLSNITHVKDENGIDTSTIDWDATFKGFEKSLSGVGEILQNIITRAFDTVDDLGGIIFSTIATKIQASIDDSEDETLAPLTKIFSTLGEEDGILGRAISEGIAAGTIFGTGAGIVTALITTITRALENPEQFFTEIETLGQSIGQFFDYIWNGPFIDNDPSKGRRENKGLRRLFFGSDDPENMSTIKTDIRNAAGEIQREVEVIGKNHEGIFDKLFGYDVNGGPEKGGHHVLGFFERMFDDLVNELPKKFDNIWERVVAAWDKSKVKEWVVAAFDDAKAAVQGVFDDIWTDIYNKIAFVRWFGNNPNSSNVSVNEETGQTVISSSSGGSFTFEKGGISSEALEFLSYIAPYIDVNEKGFNGFTGGLADIGKDFFAQNIGLQALVKGIFANRDWSGNLGDDNWQAAIGSTALDWLTEMKGPGGESLFDVLMRLRPEGTGAEEEGTEEGREGARAPKGPQMASNGRPNIADKYDRYWNEETQAWNYTPKDGKSGISFKQQEADKEDLKATEDSTVKTKEYTTASKTAASSATAASNAISSLSSSASSAGNSVSSLGTSASSASSSASTLSTNLGNAAGGASTVSSNLNTLALAASSAARALSGIHALKNAWGGRYGSSIFTEVGEDGPEYIIPITKPERAYALLNQMFSEMGESALNRVVRDFGLSTPGTVGNALGSGAMGNAVVNNTFYITAPVNIVVNSTAASSDDIGSSVYNIAKRHLETTLRGVYA